MSHPLRVRGLKLSILYNHRSFSSRRILYGCVDWNGKLTSTRQKNWVSRILYGCVDWNDEDNNNYKEKTCRILYGCVDWNTKSSGYQSRYCSSHPLRVRGLKRDQYTVTLQSNTSHPLRVRGLKLFKAKNFSDAELSHPLRVRGLKQTLDIAFHHPLMSYLIEVRGLKRIIRWQYGSLQRSYLIEVRGLKLNITPVHLNPVTSHPLRMRHVPFSERSNHHRFNLLSEFVSLLRITILSIIINKIQTTTKRKCHYSSIDCSYVIYLY